MAVLSTLQGYALDSVQQLQESGALDLAVKNKWSLLAGALTLYAGYTYLSRPKNLPPGPMGIPVLGAMLNISMNLHLDGIRFTEKYKSDIISYYLGRQLYIMLNTPEALKLAFVKTDDFSYRDDNFAKDLDLHEQFFSGPFNDQWKKLKTFCVSSLKTHGFGSNRSEDNMKLQLTRMIAHIASAPGTGIDSKELKKLFANASACVIIKILVNQNFEYDEKELKELIDGVEKFMHANFENLMVLFFANNLFPPFIMWFLKRRAVKAVRKTVVNLREIFYPILRDHRETLDLNNSRDFMDDILIRNEKGSNLTDLQMIDSFVLFTPDAIDTFSSQFGWILFYSCWHPEVQEKAFKEIKAACGEDQPSLKDRNKLPYCDAVILETLRLSSVAAVTGPHINIEDTKLNGYYVPKNTQVFGNLYAVNYNEKLYPEPEKFKPERFISSNGTLANYEAMMAFGTGARKCIGESLIKSECFLYFTGLVQKFEMSFVEGHKPTSMVSDNIYRKTPDHKLKFIPRY